MKRKEKKIQREQVKLEITAIGREKHTTSGMFTSNTPSTCTTNEIKFPIYRNIMNKK